MTSELINPLDKLKTALAEVREHRHLFSDESFSTIVMSLLDRIRRLQVANVTGSADEIRLVTVIFVDVINSTEMAQAMDTGDFKHLLEEAHRRMSALVLEWDGTIGQYLGDGILAFFGAQRSRGDDAIRCVSCALALQNDINAYANEVFLEYGVEFSIRVGISTGRVVVGMVGTSDRQELLALGPATNLASRLQSEAPPGGIYLDSATQSRLRSQFQLQARPMLRVKGYDEPVLVFEVLGRSETVAASLVQTTLAALPVPLIGREDTLTEIAADILTALQDGHLYVVLLTGEIGMGKSHILQETMDKVDQDRFLRLQMVAQHEFQMKPYNLLRDFLIRFCSLSDSMSAADIAQRIVDTINNSWTDETATQTAELMGYLAGFGFHSSSHVRALLADGAMDSSQVHQEISRFFRGMVQQTHMPLLLILDNLQWADVESIRMLQVMASELHDLPITILAAARPVFDTQYPSFMKDHELYHRVTLDRLSDETTQRMIGTILKPIERVPANVVSMIVERAQGNPLFVIEFLSMLFDSGVFHRGRDGHWRFNMVLYDSTYHQLPAGLIEVIQSRLDDIEPDVRQVLQLAAVIGQTFWKSILDELAEGDQSSALDMLQIRGIINRDPDSAFEGDTQYSFRHSLYCQVAYEMLPRARREQFHRHISAWMTGRVAGKPDFFTLLADQFSAAGETEAALFTYLEAAQHSVKSSMMNETLKLVERALSLGRTIPREVAIGATVQLWTTQAQALIGLRRYSEASASAQSALRLFSEMNTEVLPANRVTALRLLATAYTSMGEFSLAQDAIDIAFQQVDRSDHVQLSSVLCDLATVEKQTGRLALALEHIEQSIASARKTEQSALLTTALGTQGRIWMDRGRFGRALTSFEECLEIDMGIGLQIAESLDLLNIGIIYLHLHLYDQAEHALLRARQRRSQHNEKDLLLEANLQLVWLHRGEIVNAATQIEALTTQEQAGYYRRVLVKLALVDALLHQADYEQALHHTEVLAAELQRFNPLLYGRVLMRKGFALMQLGNADGLNLLKQGLASEHDLGGHDLARGYLWLAETAPAEAITAYRQAAISLYDTARDLATRPDLRYAFLQTPFARHILDNASLDDTDASEVG